MKLRLHTIFPPEISVERIAVAVVEIDARSLGGQTPWHPDLLND